MEQRNDVVYAVQVTQRAFCPGWRRFIHVVLYGDATSEKSELEANGYMEELNMAYYTTMGTLYAVFYMEYIVSVSYCSND